MRSKLKEISESMKGLGFDNSFHKRPKQAEKQLLKNPSSRLTNLLENYSYQTESINLITEILQNMNQLLSIINSNLHSVIGSGEAKKSIKKLSREERISILKNKLLFDGRSSSKRRNKH